MWHKSMKVLQWAGLMLVLLALVPFPALPAGAEGGSINQAALLHDSRDTLYRVPGGAVEVGTRIKLRFRTAAGDVDSVAVRIYRTEDKSQAIVPLAVVTTTPDGYDLWETTLDTGRETTLLWYRFLVTKGDTTLYYEDDTRPEDGRGNYVASREGGPGAVYENSPDLSYQIVVYDPSYYTPEWMRNAIIYQIFPDRFRNGDPTNDPQDGSDTFYGELPLIFHETWNEPPVDGRVTQAPSGIGYFNSDFYGGDLAGIIEKLDYLQDLGVTALYLNPIFLARSNHRYDTADFKALDPLLGDMDDFRTLVAEAKARGMVLILDGVFNHLSSDSAFFDRYHRFETDGACESLDSAYRKWFFFVPPKANQPAACVDTPDGATYYISWAGFDSIPKINSNEIGPRQYIFLDEDSVAQFWGREGIGGWRLDVAGDIDPGGKVSNYWEAFRAVVRRVNPEAVIIGEEWADASPWFLGKEWDSTMNYRLRNGVIGFVRDTTFQDNDANGDRIIYALTPSEFDGLLRAIEEDYPPMAYHALMNLLGSHDNTRLFFALDNNVQLQKLAALLQFTLPGAPTIYYGDEISIDAPSIPDSGGNLQDDPYNRAPYPWPDTTGDYYPPPNEDTLAFYQQLGALRHANPALREGEMITLLTADDLGIYAFLRRDVTAGNAALVVLNNSEADQSVDLSLAGLVPDGVVMTPTFGNESEVASASFTVSVNANSGEVWTMNTGAPFVFPAPPIKVTALGEADRVTLTWEASPDAQGYMIYRSPVSYGGFEPLTTEPVAGTEYVDESVTNGFKYYYAVATVGADGLLGRPGANYLAIPSQTIGATFYLGDDAADPVPAAYEPAVLPLTIGATVDIQAGVRIEGVTEAEGQAVGVRAEAALVPDGTDLADAAWVPMAYTAEQNGADLYQTQIEPGTAGEYLMVARFSTNAGESWTVVTYRDGSLPRLVVEPPDDTVPPDAPPAVRIKRASLSGVIVEWDAPAADDLYAYRVYRTGKDGETLVGEVLAADGTKYVDKAVAQGESYSYAVAAVDTALNESPKTPSEEVEVQRGIVPVTFIVTVPDYTTGEVYIAGSFGTTEYPTWDPAGIVMEQVDATHWQVTLDLPEGANLEYKFVRGDWAAVEKGADCEEIANRRLSVTISEEQDTLTAEHEVLRWRDLDACG